jgi:hypothetical protein
MRCLHSMIGARRFSGPLLPKPHCQTQPDLVGPAMPACISTAAMITCNSECCMFCPQLRPQVQGPACRLLPKPHYQPSPRPAAQPETCGSWLLTVEQSEPPAIACICARRFRAPAAQAPLSVPDLGEWHQAKGAQHPDVSGWCLLEGCAPGRGTLLQHEQPQTGGWIMKNR